MAKHGIKIVEKDGITFLSGELNEYADLKALTTKPPPLRLNLKGVSRVNSIGIRNLLKFLADWGAKDFEYHEVPSEFIDQINMIPALLGGKGNGKIVSLVVPYACTSCDYEAEVLENCADFASVKDGSEPPARKCPKCGGSATVLTDSYFAFLQR